ncbi:radical SAM protein [Clostridium rectalis]|uniref:radical SAM protein n=1 Tax=Clostridium rectalis TaxID=2040295 RepID=UPI000F64470B|nr:radical SAM protein [Clostridium rectalis]
MLQTLKECTLCPKNCKTNRLNNNLGVCKSGNNVKISLVSLHQWEEPCISGTKGSGTIFFSNCNLSCVFCQNHFISQESNGKEISIKRLSQIFMEQQQREAHNINLVTPTHYVPQIIEALKLAKQNGLTIPIVYNTNSYENIETLKSLRGYVDIYLPDLKYFSNKYSEKYSNAKDYFKYASLAIKEMVDQIGPPVFDNESGLMKRGVIIRHMMLPGLLFDSKKIVDFIYNTFGNSVYLSIMNQYTPLNKSNLFPEINMPLSKKHYDSLINYCISLGIENAFIQEDGTVNESFIPNFDFKGV